MKACDVVLGVDSLGRDDEGVRESDGSDLLRLGDRCADDGFFYGGWGVVSWEVYGG